MHNIRGGNGIVFHLVSIAEVINKYIPLPDHVALYVNSRSPNRSRCFHPQLKLVSLFHLPKTFAAQIKSKVAQVASALLYKEDYFNLIKLKWVSVNNGVIDN